MWLVWEDEMMEGIKNQQGVTLLELVLVLALVILAVSLPLISFNWAIQAVRLENTALAMKSQLRLLQSQAVTEAQYYEMRFDRSLKYYRIFRGSQQLKVVRFPPGIRYGFVNIGGSQVVPVLRFYPTGSPSAGGTITLENSYNSKRYIIITPAVGRVRVSRQPPIN